MAPTRPCCSRWPVGATAGSIRATAFPTFRRSSSRRLARRSSPGSSRVASRHSWPRWPMSALQVETRVQGDHTHLLVTAPPTSGATVTVSAVTPDLADTALTLSPTGAGRFEGDLATDQVGSYLLHITQSAGGVVRHTTTTGLVVPYSPEYRDLGTNTATLKAIAQAGGGIVLSDLAQAFRLPVPSVKAAQPISEILLVLAILLFPLDVALRRLIFRLEDLPAWRTALQRAPVAAVPAEATVRRLRERVEGLRATRAAQPRPPKKPPEDPTGDLLARRRRR